MRLRNRFLLVALGIFVFVLTTPVITLYSLGYKFDLSTRQIQKTGTMVVRSEPDGATIHLSDMQQARRTDSTIRFLLPGDYVVKISKAGYQSWTKRLSVLSSLVTWANDGRDFVALFMEEPALTKKTAISSFTFEPESQSLAAIKDGKVMAYDAGRGELEEASSAVPDFVPPASIQSRENLYYINRYPPAQVLTSEQVSNARRVEANDAYAAALIGTELVYVRDGAVLPLAMDVSGFDLDGDHLWYVQKSDLKRISLKQGVIETIAQMGISPIDSKIVRGRSEVFLVLDQVLYALNDQLKEIRRGVTYAYWDDPSSRLVAATNNEVSLFDPTNFRSELVIRSTTTVSQPVVNQATGYLFFLNEGKIKAIELDGRDHRNVYTISGEPARAFIISEDGETLGLINDASVASYRIR